MRRSRPSTLSAARGRGSKKCKKKLIKIVKSPKPEKKYRAVFCRETSNGSKIKNIDFGSKGMSDYTKHRDPERKQRYIQRHRSRENWEQPDNPGSLSRWILWNKPSFRESVKSYKKKFHL
jgi:hypothetical protein